jgi:hypothetical protein
MGSTRGTWPFPTRSVVALLAFGLVGATSVGAQTPQAVTRTSPGTPGVGVVAPPPSPPAPEFGFEESLSLEQGGLREESSFPERIRGVYAPAFVKGATQTVRTSKTSGFRWGLSGWTSTRIPYDDRNAGGGPALGLTFEFGVPLPPPPEETPDR